MSKTTYPQFGEMMPVSEDIQLIVDAFKDEDRKRLTLDGIFNPGIVNEVAEYLQAGTNENTLKIIPFVAYTKAGNRIEVQNTYDFLIAQSDGSIVISDENIVNKEKNVPYWYHYNKNYTNFTDATAQTFRIAVTELKPSSILQGIKMKHVQQFIGCGDVYISIGTETEPEKFTPKFLISDAPTDTNIETSNILYSESGENYTPIYAYFTCSLNTLNNLISGSIDISLCITDVSNVDYDEKETEGGIPLVNVKGKWKENTTYYIVARYEENKSNLTSINIHNDEVDIDTVPFYSRITDSFKFFALRRTGSIIDPITDNDVKLGRVVSDADGNITIYTNNYNRTTKIFDTDYLTLPGARFLNFAYEDIETYMANKLNKTGDTMTGALTMSVNTPINLNGSKNYNIVSKSSESQLNILSTDNRGLVVSGNDDELYYFDGTTKHKLYNTNDSVANQDLSNLSNSGLAKFVQKEGDTMLGALYVPNPISTENSAMVATTSWVRSLITQILGETNMLRRMDFSNPTTATNNFTCPSDGYVFLRSDASGTDAKINDTVISIYATSTATQSYYPLPVSSGDVIQRGGTALGTLYITFVPELVQQ